MRRRAIASCTIFAGLAACLLATAVPSLLAAATRLPSDPTVEALAEGQRASPADLASLVAASAAARRFVPSPRYDTDMATGLLRLALAAPSGSADRQRLLQETATALRRGLAAQPANSFAWARLAETIAQLDPDPAAPLAAWRLSIDTAPAEPRLAEWRARFGAQRLALLDAADRARLLRQTMLARSFYERGYRVPQG
ncbi:MAG: hypothetical protein U1E53_04895 [Dongiaceae bacterium]